jgi:hypothetical protein
MGVDAQNLQTLSLRLKSHARRLIAASSLLPAHDGTFGIRSDLTTCAASLDLLGMAINRSGVCRQHLEKEVARARCVLARAHALLDAAPAERIPPL